MRLLSVVGWYAVWDMYERVFIAALDAHDDQTINVSSSLTHHVQLRCLCNLPAANPLTIVLPSVCCRQWCLENLLHKFGNTGLRMTRLLGLHCEYQQRYDEAAEHYAAILAADPTQHRRPQAHHRTRQSTQPTRHSHTTTHTIH